MPRPVRTRRPRTAAYRGPRRRPKAELAEIGEEARRLADRLPMAVYVAPSRIAGAFHFMSAGVERMLGRPRQAWTSDPKLWVSSLHPSDRGGALQALARSAHRHQLTYRLRGANGAWRWIEDTGWHEGWGSDMTLGLWLDVTEGRRREAALSEARTEAVRLRRHLVRLMTAASHTLRTPVRQIVSLTDIVGRRNADAAVAGLLSTLRESAASIEKRLELLAGYSEAVLRAPQLADVSCAEAFAAALEQKAELARQTRAVVTSDALPLVRADAHRLTDLLARLLDNALRHGGARPRVHVFSQRSGGHWVISVRDHGPGLPAETLKWLLTPFDASEKKPGGLGPSLSLAICREYAESHGGRLWAESEPGSGSTFSFSVPAAFAEEGI